MHQCLNFNETPDLKAKTKKASWEPKMKRAPVRDKNDPFYKKRMPRPKAPPKAPKPQDPVDYTKKANVLKALATPV